jgi:hypothetical protein
MTRSSGRYCDGLTIIVNERANDAVDVALRADETVLGAADLAVVEVVNEERTLTLKQTVPLSVPVSHTNAFPLSLKKVGAVNVRLFKMVRSEEITLNQENRP